MSNDQQGNQTEVESSPLAKLTALLLSEVAGQPEYETLSKDVTEVFTEHCLEEAVAVSAPRRMSP